MNQKVSFKLNYQNVLFLILLFVTSFAIFMLRNLDPITYPTLYAEDALWTEKLLSKGFIDTAFNTRSFPILGFVIFYQLGLLIVNIFAQGNIFYLPLAYFILSNIFFALIIVSLVLTFYKRISRISIFAIMVAVYLMPVGLDGNEIYGRILNLGFIFPVMQVILLSSLIFSRKSSISVSAIFIFTFISCLTFPVGIGIVLIFSFICGARYYFERNTYYLTLLLISLLLAFSSILLISGTAINDKGGADLPVNLQAFIEFSGARALIYPLVFSFYHYLSDMLTLTIVLIVAVVITSVFYVSFKNDKRLFTAQNYFLLFIWASFFLYYLSIIVLRRGLSGLFDNYQSSFPDRYFLGLNLLFMIALIYSFDRFKFTRLLSLIAVVPMIFFAKSAFELNKPATKFNTSYTWTSEFCYSLTDRNSVLKSISVPPQGWQMNLDLSYFSELQKNIFNEKCKESVLYQIPFLDKFEPLFLVQKNDTGNSQSLEAKFTGISNGTKIEEHDGYVLVDVNGDDPHILLSSSSLYKIDTDLRTSVFLNIKSSAAEVVQIYYSIKGSQGFSEQESIFVDIVPGENPIYINMSNVINPNTLRIDFPEGHGNKYVVYFKKPN